jgi:hypothetical protein
MKISGTSKIMPGGPPAQPTPSDDYYLWRELVPRLVPPGKLAIIQTLLREGRPLSPAELVDCVEINIEHARHHCELMDSKGVLEIVDRVPRPDGDGNEPCYLISKPSQAPPSSEALRVNAVEEESR